MELKKYKLGEILELQRGYDLPSSQMKIGSVPVAGSNGVIGYHDTARGNYPCITVGRSGSVGKVHYYEQPTWAHNTALFVKNFKGNDPKYLYYFLKNLHLDEMFSKGSSVVPSLDRKVVHSLIVPFQEDKTCQKQIASVLSNIDRKIELNRAINQNLEAMAKQLYDYWFVQFDFPNEEGKPYKSSGGEMVWNEKLRKDIPEYWEVKSLSNWLEIKSGFPFKSETYKPIGRYKIITIKNVQDGELVTSGCDYVNEIPSRAKDYISLQIGDRLISLTGNCGRLCVVCEENLLLNQRVGLLCCDAIYLEYFYNFLNSSTMRTVIDNLANGAAQANLSPVELCKTDYFIPPIDILLSYNRKANAIRKVIVQNNQEISPLTKQRDELLPLLMNGQVSVNSDLSLG